MTTTLSLPQFERLLLRGDAQALDAANFPDAAALCRGHIDPFLPDLDPPSAILPPHTASVQLAHQVALEAATSVTIRSPRLEQIFTTQSPSAPPEQQPSHHTGLYPAYVAGVALLEAFLRDNWAGPSIQASSVHVSSIPTDNSAFYLTLDGEDVAAPAVSLYCLRAARFILVDTLPSFTRAGAHLIHWWAARALLAHQAILSNPSPTLQSSIFSNFASFLGPHAAPTPYLFASQQHHHSAISVQHDDHHQLLPSPVADHHRSTTLQDDHDDYVDRFHHHLADATLVALAHLELSLAQRIFYDADGALASLRRACQAARVTVTVSGQLGVRTKHQTKQTAQLIARSYQLLPTTNSPRPDLTPHRLSFLFPVSTPTSSPATSSQPPPQSSSLPYFSSTTSSSSSTSSSDPYISPQHLPIPQHIQINDPDVLGYVKLLPSPKSTSSDVNPPSVPREDDTDEDDSDDETHHQLFPDSQLDQELEYLTPLEQALALAHAATIRATNASHLLTKQEMAPYIDLVLRNINSPYGTSSVIQIRALLYRVSFERNRGRYLERCLAQMEEISKFIQDAMQHQSQHLRARSASERVALTLASALPPRWEIMKELAMSFGKIGLVKSAMEIFQRLHMWDELVDCHRLIGNLGRAESLVREHLQLLDAAVLDDGIIRQGDHGFDPNNPLSNRAVQERAARRPRLLCVLGEVTREEKHFETAWSESGGRYARAKRALARLCVERQKWHEAVAHYRDALRVNHLFPDAWFDYGCAAIRIADLQLAAHAFTMVVKQTPENGEAWNNLGRVLYDTGKKKESLRAMFEAGKVRRESWRIWENAVTIATEIRSCLDIVRAMERLVELRGREGVVAEPLGTAVSEVIRMSSSTNAEDKAMLKSVCKRLLRLLGKCTSVVSTNASVWAAYAQLHEVMPNADSKQKAFDCRLKQVRALMAHGNWKSELNEFRHMARACIAMSQIANTSGSADNVRVALSLIDSVLSQANDHFHGDEAYADLQHTRQTLETA